MIEFISKARKPGVCYDPNVRAIKTYSLNSLSFFRQKLWHRPCNKYYHGGNAGQKSGSVGQEKKAPVPLTSQRNRVMIVIGDNAMNTTSDSSVVKQLSSPFRTYQEVNKAILSGYIKPRDMSKVTLTNEQRPRFRPILRNHWACYMTGQNTITELSFHVDGIIIKLWEKDLNGVAFVKEVHDIGLDMNLVWTRFERDVKFGRACLSDDSSTYQRFLSKAQLNKFGATIARRDGISLMVRWLRRQERFIVRQQELLMTELKAVGAALGKSAFVGYADYEPELSEEAIEKRKAQAKAVRVNAIHKALISRACRMPETKVSEVLDSAPANLCLKQSAMRKIEGGYSAGVGNKGQIDSFRSAPKNPRKQSAESIMRDMAVRQLARAEKALNDGDISEAETLFRLAAETETKANSLKH